MFLMAYQSLYVQKEEREEGKKGRRHACVNLRAHINHVVWRGGLHFFSFHSLFHEPAFPGVNTVSAFFIAFLFRTQMRVEFPSTHP